uniref:Uncharacterized protein n=1 Tax=Onchocerca volvulus TaxID=6282 RepID=A0A8R1XLP1_ONCVO
MLFDVKTRLLTHKSSTVIKDILSSQYFADSWMIELQNRLILFFIRLRFLWSSTAILTEVQENEKNKMEY